MKCDLCNDGVATVHLTEIVHKQKREMHLCEDCARRQGVSVKSALVEQSASAQATPVAHPPVVAPAKAVVAPEVVSWPACPVCGMSFADVRSTGRLGCANCYTAFKRGLVTLLDKIHGQTEHRGKVPAQASRRQERQRQVVELRRQLNEAIQKEAYEDAARLRDEIYSLEER